MKDFEFNASCNLVTRKEMFRDLQKTTQQMQTTTTTTTTTTTSTKSKTSASYIMKCDKRLWKLQDLFFFLTQRYMVFNTLKRASYP